MFFPEVPGQQFQVKDRYIDATISSEEESCRAARAIQEYSECELE